MRYVAMGDSISEGVGDTPWPDGSAQGWTDRLAVLLDEQHGSVEYANLAVRGYQAGQVRDRQLAAALALAPDVVTITAGMNDILRPRVDFDELTAILSELVVSFTASGAQVLLVPVPDVTGISPAGKWLNAAASGSMASIGSWATSTARHPSPTRRAPSSRTAVPGTTTGCIRRRSDTNVSPPPRPMPSASTSSRDTWPRRPVRRLLERCGPRPSGGGATPRRGSDGASGVSPPGTGARRSARPSSQWTVSAELSPRGPARPSRPEGRPC